MITECKKMELFAVCEGKTGSRDYKIEPFISGEALPKGYLKIFVDRKSAETCIETAATYKDIIMPSIDVV